MPKEIVWTKLHDLVYLFIALAHGADQDLAKAEAEEIVRQVVKREPLKLQEGARALINEVARVYKDDRRKNDRTRLAQAIKRLKKGLSEDERKEALADLLALAQADGVILDKEWDFVDDVKEAWGLGAA